MVFLGTGWLFFCGGPFSFRFETSPPTFWSYIFFSYSCQSHRSMGRRKGKGTDIRNFANGIWQGKAGKRRKWHFIKTLTVGASDGQDHMPFVVAADYKRFAKWKPESWVFYCCIYIIFVKWEKWWLIRVLFSSCLSTFWQTMVGHARSQPIAANLGFCTKDMAGDGNCPFR